MNNKLDPSVDTFNQDAAQIGGYVYTSGRQLSSRLATSRTTQVMLETNLFNQKRVVDIGCGDGYFTHLFAQLSQPCYITGMDAAHAAMIAANKPLLTNPDPRVSFLTGDAHHLPYPSDSFDIALLQSVLHHDFDPLLMIKEAFRIAPIIVIHEPNGNSPILKLFERIMPYHREHKERSYSTPQLNRWIVQAGGNTISQRFAGFVPMFAPDFIAKFAKRIEPATEGIKPIAYIGCAVTVIVAERNTGS